MNEYFKKLYQTTKEIFGEGLIVEKAKVKELYEVMKIEETID